MGRSQSDKICLYGELELRSRLFQENHAKDCQEIEELRSICCEEADRARQARSDELSVQRETIPAAVSQMMAQTRELQNKVNSLSDAGELYDTDPGSSSGATHVLDQTSTIPSSRTKPRCAKKPDITTHGYVRDRTSNVKMLLKGTHSQKRHSCSWRKTGHRGHKSILMLLHDLWLVQK